MFNTDEPINQISEDNISLINETIDRWKKEFTEQVTQ